MNSIPASSASFAAAVIASQSALHRFSTVVKARPPSALTENNPSLNGFALRRGWVRTPFIGPPGPGSNAFTVLTDVLYRNSITVIEIRTWRDDGLPDVC